jgi:hypothetical protein
MNRKLSPSDILERLRAIDGLVEDGVPLADALNMAGVDAETHAKWRSEYGALLRLVGSPAKVKSRGANARRGRGRSRPTIH